MRNPAGREFEIEYRIITKDGDVRWLRDRGFPIRNESGQIYRVGGVAEDITDRKEAEDRLKASSEQLARVVRQPSIGARAGGHADRSPNPRRHGRHSHRLAMGAGSASKR